MVAPEQYFPRGGKKPKVNFNEKKKFDFLGNADRIGKKKKYKTPKHILEKNEFEDDHLSDASDDSNRGIKSVSAEAISEKTLQEGMIIMGRVMNIFDTKVIVSLPGRLSGVVMACHISSSYTKIMQAFVNDEVEEMKRLPDLFKVGEYVSVKVLSVASTIGRRNTVTLSMLPDDINRGFSFNTVKKGMLLRGSVDSIEDHGYVIDLGIPNCRTFLPSKNAEKDLTLDVGQLIWCIIKKCDTTGTNSIIVVSNQLDSIKSTSISGDKVQKFTIADLRPGMALNFSVHKPLPDGAEGFILSKSTGYIHVSQIDGKLKTGETVQARLLYIMPLTKFGFFTTRKIFDSFRPDQTTEANVKVGQIIEDAKVSKVTATSIIFRFEGSVGVMSTKEVYKNQGISGDKNIAELYPSGSQHRIRITHYHLSDYAYICTDNEIILQQKYFRLSDLSIGDIVEAVVENVSHNGLCVKVGAVKGWIPELHASDVALFNSANPNQKGTKLIMKKFQTGQKINARVLKLNVVTATFQLTAKTALLEPDTFILKNFEDAQVGRAYKGVIVQYLKFGVMVAFFGEVKAIVPREHLSHEKVKDIAAAFKIGQVVNCTIMNVEASEGKINGSFISPGKITLAKNKKDKKSKKRSISEVDEIPIEEPVKSKRKKTSSVSDIVESNDDGAQPIESKKKKKNRTNSLTNDDETDEIVTKKAKKNKKKLTEPEIIENIPTSKKKKARNAEETIANSTTEDEPSKKCKKKKKLLNNEEEIITPVEDFIKIGKKNKITEIEQQNEKISKKKMKLEKSKKSTDTETKFPGIGNFWDSNAGTISKNIAKSADYLSSSDSETEKAAEEPKKKKKKLTTAEKVEKARSDEEKLRNIEKQLAESNSQPQSSDQFDRLLMANPNSSELWIAYMAFHLQATEIERARSVGKKAISIISFREEEEKLNVWLAMLNLENRFGTKESLTVTLQEALQMNETFKVHSKMLDMYADTGKEHELLTLVDSMVAKYRGNPETYMMAGEACYKLNLVEKARSVMQRAVQRLDNKKHIPVLVKFAQMENARGDSERAEALIEQIVSCLPQRVDVWCVYVDMLMKSNKLDNARLILERAVSHKLTARKMKTLYKKWMEIEEKLGNTEQVERVRQMALEFVEKAAN